MNCCHMPTDGAPRAAVARRSDLLAILDAGPISPAELAFLSQQRRKRALLSIDTLIDLLDAIDPDPDLEPTMGFVMPGEVDEAEPDADYEQILGSPEVEFSDFTGRINRHGHIDQRRWADGYHAVNGWDVNREHDTADEEPMLAMPEQHPSRYGLDRSGGGDQRLWACSVDVGEREDVSEDEGACIQSQKHDPEGDEPSLGSPEVHHDQRRWGQGKGSREGDHDEHGWGGNGMRRRDDSARTRCEVKAMLRRLGVVAMREPAIIMLGPNSAFYEGRTL